MRTVTTMMIVALWAAGLPAQQPKEVKPARRYGIEADVVAYPQDTPKNALASVLKAIEADKINYLLAQLADPGWVDQRVKQVHAGKFEALVEETAGKLANDGTTIKELRRFLHEGTWEATESAASSQLKDIKNRRVYLRELDGRWFFETRQQARAADKEK
jgi:hypothetical protein